MTDEISLFEKFKETGKHGIVYGIGSTVNMAIAFVLIPVYTTHLVTSDYGILGLISMTGNILGAIFGLGLISALFRSYYDYDNEENRREVISTAFFLIGISCGTLFISGIFFSKYLSILLFGNTEYEVHLLILVSVTVIGILNQIPFTIFRVRKESIHYVIFQTSFFTIGLVSIIYLVAIKNWGVMGALVGNLIMATVSFFILFFYIRKDIILKFSKLEARKMVYFGLPLILANLTAFAINYSDRYILSYYSTFHEVGLYNLGYQFGMVVMILFVTPIAMIWSPMYLSVKNHSNAKDFYSRALTYGIFIGSFLFLVLSLLSKEVIYIFSNKEYWSAHIVVPLIALPYTLWGIQRILNVGIGLKRKTKATAMIFSLGAIINLGLNFVLIPEYGMMGAAFATLFSFLVMVISSYFYNQKLIKINYEWKRILQVCLVTALIFIVGYRVKFNDLYGSLTFKIGIILLYPLILYLVRFYSTGEIEKIRRIFGRILIKLNNQ